jgi:hypothetical protein
MEKTSPNVMGFESKATIDMISGINQRCIPESVRFFSIFFPLRESRRAPDPALPRDRNSRLWLHPRRLGSEALRLLQRWGKIKGILRCERNGCLIGYALVLLFFKKLPTLRPANDTSGIINNIEMNPSL